MKSAYRTPPGGMSAIAAVALVLSLVMAACSNEPDTIRLGEDSFAPDVTAGSVDSDATGEVISFSYDDFDGNERTLDDLPPGPVVVNFFASWCPTCVAELPDFESVSQSLDGQITFLGLAMQDREEASIALIEETGVTFATGKDQNGGVFGLFGGLSMPTTVFLNADHEVVRVHSGVLDAASLTDVITDELLS